MEVIIGFNTAFYLNIIREHYKGVKQLNYNTPVNRKTEDIVVTKPLRHKTRVRDKN